MNKVLKNIDVMLKIIQRQSQKWVAPVVGQFSVGENAPFKVLISTVLSLRTKDQTTHKASLRLFELAQTPDQMLKLSNNQIEKLIYPVGFYRVKAKNILQISQILVDKYNGKVPDNLEELLLLPGVGRKTANLVISIGYNKPGICVDTHVHRITNRWGLLDTTTPNDTELRLRKILPAKHWHTFNEYLVAYGQNLCVPISPHCSQCKIRSYCQRRNVTKSR